MKDIRIFIASSRELVRERNALAFLVLAHEEAFAARGLRVRLAKWEYVDPKMTEARTEDRYLDEMYASDAALVLFRNIAGMYTREELDKALAAEKAGKVRLKAHEILFDASGSPDSDAAKLRASLPEGSYGVWSGPEELRERFLALVDRVAQCEGLTEAPDEHPRTVSAFIAVDNELASDRDAFADTVLNLNDILSRRGIHVKLRFYNPDLHREMLDESEMALVLYHTNCNAFGPEQMEDAYDRTKREANPKRLYVFFRDADDSRLDPSFVEFKKGFVENLGHFFCQFENADTLKLNFLLSLESTLGEGASFVKLDGRKIKAGELEVAEITKLPMVANNEGLNVLMRQLEEIGTEFDELSARCRQDPMNDNLYADLLELTAKRDELQKRVDKELGQSLNLAKRLSAVSIAEAQSTFVQARSLMEAGKIKEALDILDGASSRISSIRSRFAARAEQEDRDVQELVAWKDVELFRADALLSYSALPFTDRFKRVEQILADLVCSVEECLNACQKKNEAKVLKALMELYSYQGDFYSANNDDLNAAPAYRRALEKGIELERIDADFPHGSIVALQLSLGEAQSANNNLSEAMQLHNEALAFYRAQRDQKGDNPDVLTKIVRCLRGLAFIYDDLNDFVRAESAFEEALETARGLVGISAAEHEPVLAGLLSSIGGFHVVINDSRAGDELSEAMSIYRRLVEKDPAKYEIRLANCGRVYAHLCGGKGDCQTAEQLIVECLDVNRKLVESNPLKYSSSLGSAYLSSAIFYRNQKRFDKAEECYLAGEALFRRLVQHDPVGYEEMFSRILTNYAMMLADADRLPEAETVYGQTLEVRRRLVERDFEKYRYFLANTLIGLAAVLVKEGKNDAAWKRYDEALGIRRGLIEKRPEKFEPDVAGLLLEMSKLADLDGDGEKKGALFDEASGIFAKWGIAQPWPTASEMMRGYLR